MKNFYVFANWKLNKKIYEIDDTINTLLQFSSDVKKNNNISNIKIVILPSFLSLNHIANRIKNSIFEIGSQNISNHNEGSFTGEISASDLYNINVKYALIGHSERRILYKEDDLIIKDKINIAINNNIIPIVCLGELNDQKNPDFVVKQVYNYINLISKHSIRNVIFIYEPIFAIGKENAIDIHYVCDVINLIKNTISNYHNIDKHYLNVQYGGSLSQGNINLFLKEKQIDGLLIGRASIDCNHFINILKLVIKYKSC